MRLFKRRPGTDKVTLEIDAPKMVSSTRALYQGPREMPRIQAKITLDHGVEHPASDRLVDEIVVEMDVYQATAFMDQMHASLKAAMPSRPRASYNTPYGE